MKNFLFQTLLASLVLAAAPASAATYTFTASGTAIPSTSGVDTWGNPWLIRDFGGVVHFGMPGIFTGGPIASWACPDCLLEVQVSAVATFNGGAPASLTPDNTSTQLFRNITDNSNYNYTIVGNTIDFTAVPGFDIHIGDAVNVWTFFQTPFAAGTNYQVTVTYITDDTCVPEPASLALIGSGLLLAGLVKRRRL